MPDITIAAAPTGPNAPAAPVVPAAPAAPVTGSEGLILGKFKTAEDLQKAYLEAEKKITELGQKPKTEHTNLTPDTARVSGVDLDAMTEEFAKNQKLSPESMKKLNDAGFPEAVVTAYIKGQEALGNKFVEEVASVAGGMEGLKRVLEWSKVGLTASEQKVYNDALKTNNPDAVKPILRDMVDKYFSANGRAPTLIGGENVGPTGGEAFASMQQVTEAMRDPRYKKDEAFRKSVAEKLKNSKFQGR